MRKLVQITSLSNYPGSKSNANKNLWASFLVGVHFKAQTLSAVRLTKEPYHVYSTPSLPPNGLKQPQCKTK